MERDRILRVLATVCFFVLLCLQYKLLSSSYEIENREYSKAEKRGVKDAYEQAIINDKLYPGGQEVIDRYLSKEILQSLYRADSSSRIVLTDSLRAIHRHVVAELRTKSNIDSLLSAILEPLHLDREMYGYALTLDDLAVSMDGRNYFSLVAQDRPLPALIDGDSTYVASNNIISSVSVSSSSAYSYRVKFTLYGLNLAHGYEVFKKIFPLLALTAISVLMIAVTYIRTFRNWQKQKKLNEISQDFLNSITHEFKTPIASIAVSVKNLVRETQGLHNKRVSQSIEVIERQSQRIDHLVDRAIGISMFNPNQICLEHRNLTEDMDIIVYNLQLKYVNTPHVFLDFKTQKEEVFAHYDLFLLTTAINNLIENGIKHNNNREKEVVVRLFTEAKQVYVEISDNGVGIDNGERYRVFEKFYQGKQGKEKGGLGLGLYYVDQMIRVHHWKLDLKNKDDGGTVITIMIPKETL
ncbi:sensor histidine kinase [Sphingobacterium gobiense]|nr:HAMP domain-containing sensor histidine kinase [Sphingobacterium gobiense]